MARAPKKKEPTAGERQALYTLLYESSLFQAHPITVSNVCGGVENLLRVLGREDLVPVWADQETLAGHAP